MSVPFPEQAEADLTGVCVDSHASYLAARQVVSSSDFFKPAHRRLVEACSQMAHLDGPSIDVLERRIRLAARISGVPERDVQELVAERSLQWDRRGRLAARVKAAADARAAMAAAAMLYNRLSDGEPLADVLDEVSRLLAVAV